VYSVSLGESDVVKRVAVVLKVHGEPHDLEDDSADRDQLLGFYQVSQHASFLHKHVERPPPFPDRPCCRFQSTRPMFPSREGYCFKCIKCGLTSQEKSNTVACNR
jgi:hypothetical protein